MTKVNEIAVVVLLCECGSFKEFCGRHLWMIRKTTTAEGRNSWTMLNMDNERGQSWDVDHVFVGYAEEEEAT